MRENRDERSLAFADRLSRFSRRIWLYALLLGGSLVFMWPFLWMLMASFKVERELFAPTRRILPIAPIPAQSSPWIDERLYEEVDAPKQDALIPRLVERLEKLDINWLAGTKRSDSLELLAKGILDQLGFSTPNWWWDLPDEELWRKIEPEINGSMANQVARSMSRGLTIGQLLARSYDLEEDILVPHQRVREEWEIRGDADAQFLDTDISEQGQLLAYDFTAGKTIRLVAEQATSFPLERLHRIQLYLRPDDSWHAVTSHVEMKGKRYRAERIKPLSGTDWQPITLQEPGPDDLTNKKREWLTLEEIAAGPQFESRPNVIRVEVEIRKQNLLQTWTAKITRNYQLVFDSVPFFRYVSTSLFLVILQVVATIFSCSLVAYGFARLQWPGRSVAFVAMLATMMIPSQVTLIPQFLIIRELGWYNTLLPLWVPAAFANPFYVFLLYQFMKGIPNDLEAAARMDGCGALRIYWHVALPLIRPSLAAIGIFTFMGVWNDFMGPLIYLSDQRLYPLSLGLYALNMQNQFEANSMGMMMAGSFLMTLPVIVIFFFAQRYFIQGVSFSGLKG